MSGFRLVLCTHDLAPEPVAQGEELLCWLPFEAFIEMHAKVEAGAAQNNVLLELTSDDAFASDYELLFPWLLEMKRTATFFVPTAYIGRPGRLTRTQIREMRAAGMRIGIHGNNHINWAAAPRDAMREDVTVGLRTLEDLLGEPITSAAPPYGAYSKDVLRLLDNEGISEIYSCRGGYAIADGRLRSRVAIASDPVVNAGIVDLSRIAPSAKDWLRGCLHLVQAVLN